MPLSSDDLILRPATGADFDAVRSLCEALIPHDRPAEETLQRDTYADLLRHPGLTILLAVKADVPIACCTLVVIPNLTRGCAPYALIENVVTDPARRGQGIGGALMRAAIDRAFGAGCFKIMLLSGAENTSAHRFYEGLGFSTTKTGFELRAPGYAARRVT